MRYLGCKQKIAQSIVDVTKKYGENITIADVFCGTATMAEAFAKAGFNVIAGDVMQTCCVLAKCKLTVKDNLSDSLLSQINDEALVEEGFVYNSFSPAGQRHYFTENNARKIDGVRTFIESLEEPTRTHALGCLIEATSLVSNTTGTFGAWCKKVDARAQKALVVTDYFKVSIGNHKVVNCDAKTLLSTQTYDIAYLDPPYNTRQYGSNYHVMETIVRADNPTLRGKTGMRDWEDTKSVWCYKGKVATELAETLQCCKCDIVLMSYNNEGLMTKEEIEGIMSVYGKVTTHIFQFPKYKTKTNKNDVVTEYLFELNKSEPTEVADDNTQEVFNNILNTVHHMDCIAGMKCMQSETVDLILCDPPFGVTECEWDKVIDIPLMFQEFKRLIKPHGAIVIFCQQPFTSKIVLNGIDIYKYSLVWRKSKKGNFAQAPYRFMCEHEDITVFSKGKTAKNGKPRMKYNPCLLYTSPSPRDH
jgi:adenine-specific DNA-methyltransferase